METGVKRRKGREEGTRNIMCNQTVTNGKKEDCDGRSSNSIRETRLKRRGEGKRSKFPHSDYTEDVNIDMIFCLIFGEIKKTRVRSIE